MAKMKFSVGAVTDVGLRRVNNEDNFFVPGVQVKDRDVKVYDIRKTDSEALQTDSGNAFFAVCDGMGGHNAGEYASHMAVTAVQNAYARLTEKNSYDQAKEAMDEFLARMNHQICEVADASPDMKGMGCTICGLYFFSGNRFMPVNVGDSRIYMVKGGKLVQLSVDHTDTAAGKGSLTRYLGLPEEFGEITGEYGTHAEVLVKKTRFLLCSDGLTDMVKDTDILHHLKTEKTAADAADKLVDVAKKMGGIDNITAVVLDVSPVGKTLSRALRRPAAYCIAAAVLAAGAAGYAAYYRVALDPPAEEVRAGDSLAEHQAEVAAARSAEEILAALEGEGGLLPALQQSASAYADLAGKCKAEGMSVETYDEYAALNESCYGLNTGIAELETALAKAKAAADPREKESALAAIRGRVIEGGDIYRLNETAVSAAAAAQTALDTLRAQKAAEAEAARRAAEEAQKQQNQTGTSGGSSSGGSRGSSNRGSGSAGGGSGGSGSSGGSASGGSGGSSSSGDSASGGSGEPTISGGGA